MSHLIKILAALPGPGDATSLYRAVGPFSQLRKVMNISFDYSEDFYWMKVKSADIVFLQRPCNSNHLIIARMAKNCNTPLWIDVDDDLLDVPMENPVWENYRDPSVTNCIIECLKLADHVTTASDVLKEKLSKYNKNITTIPNAFDETFLKNYDPVFKSTNKISICWRGTTSHIKDLASVADDIISVSDKYPNLIWNFIGYFPWFLGERMTNKNVNHVRAIDPFEYFQFLKNSCTHQIAINPLVSNSLNLAKSNIAWQEHTFAGACVLGPDLPHWQIKGITNYNTERSFKDQLCWLIENPEKHKEFVRDSLEYIRENLFLSKINRLREQVIFKLLDHSQYTNLSSRPSLTLHESLTNLSQPIIE